MGVLDKIKNALFEVEYVEVEEPPKKEKKVKHKEKERETVREEVEDKPIAKKIVLPGRREEKIEELKEEELLDEDFEIRPKEEEKVEETEPVREQFKFMDDNDFKVDEEEYAPEPEILDSVEPERPLYGEVKQEKVYEESKHDYYSTPAYTSTRESSNNLYGRNNSYNVPVHQYGTYEKEEKTYFKPSPIISPIYGILDKNYKKEDVKEKKEIRLSGYTRSNMNVDDIRNKAYGKKEEPEELEEETKFEIEELDDNVMVDLSDRSKPEVKELTVGDAEEYFEDLGLEYNVDYVDVSTDKKKAKKEELEPEKLDEEVVEEQPKHVKEETVEEVESKEEDNDNLFDLIDSMYEE